MNLLYKYKNSLLLLAASFILLLLISPMAPGAVQANYTDSNIFQYIGKYMAQGDVLYRDLIDQKGPVIYFINAFAYLLGGSKTLWVMEILCLWAGSLIFSSIIKRRFRDSESAGQAAFWGGIFFMGFFAFFGEYGNFTEEWSLPFILIAYAILLSYESKGNRLSALQVLVLGFTCAVAFLLRPNLIVLWAAGCFVLIVDTLFRKEWLRAASYLGLFAAGFVIGTAPFAIYLMKGGALADGWFWFWQYNMTYITTGMSSKINAWYMLFVDLRAYGLGDVLGLSYLVLLLRDVFKSSGEERRSRIVDLAFFALLFGFTFISAGMSGRLYRHYNLAWLPVLALPFGRIWCSLAGLVRGEGRFGRLLPVLLFVLLMWPNGATVLFKAQKNHDGGQNRTRDIKKVASYITEHTDEDDTIHYWGVSNTAIYHYADRKSPSPYFFIPVIRNLSSELEEKGFYKKFYANFMERTLSDLEKGKPPVVVIDYSFEPNHYLPVLRDELISWLEEAGYGEVKRIDKYAVWENTRL